MIEKSVIKNTEVGAFILCDVAYLESFGGKPKNFMRIPIGNYRAEISVKSKGGWFEPASKMHRTGTLKVTTGKLFVGCPCEVFKGRGAQDRWMAFLEATNYFKKVPSSVKVISTGGDGLGEITFKLTK
jgi:hypothetical protein